METEAQVNDQQEATLGECPFRIGDMVLPKKEFLLQFLPNQRTSKAVVSKRLNGSAGKSTIWWVELQTKEGVPIIGAHNKNQTQFSVDWLEKA